MKYKLNLVRFFLLHSTKFQYFLYGFKSQFPNSYDNWYVQKYLKGKFHKGMLLIWKEYFTCTILSFSSPRCAFIARLNVIYTKFRRATIAQLNKIWLVWALTARPAVDHAFLIKKLNQYGITRVAKKWFSPYLQNRLQYVSINSFNSNLEYIHCGSSHVSGPLLV